MKADEAQIWLSYAKSDLDAAHVLLEKGDFFPRQICFMSQQAGEKAMKLARHFAWLRLSLKQSQLNLISEYNDRMLIVQ